MLATATELFAALIMGAFAATASSTAAAPASNPGVSARWTRTVAGSASPDSGKTIFALLDDGNVLLGSGTTIAALDGRSGSTLWSMPIVAGASVNEGIVVLRRAGVVFAVRSRDAGVVWKRACADPPYAIGFGDRVLTMCGGRSTVLAQRDGRICAQRSDVQSSGNIHGARALDGRYALVDTFFDGAWMGESYGVVDSHDGALMWSQTDFTTLDVTRATISIAPYPSMLPWAITGTVVRRRLSDGETLDKHVYAPPQGNDPDARGFVRVSRAAAYVSTQNGPLYRFAKTDRSAPALLFDRADVSEILGAAAFVAVEDVEHQNEIEKVGLYLDRPRSRGGFATRLLGYFGGSIRAGGDENSWGVAPAVVARADRYIAASRSRTVTLFDEFGMANFVAKNRCAAMKRHILASRDTLFVLCEQSAPTISAYSLSIAHLGTRPNPQ